VHLKAGDVDAVIMLGEIDVESVVGPGAEFQVTALVVEGKPGDVNLTS
jgi:hypothetical protein